MVQVQTSKEDSGLSHLEEIPLGAEAERQEVLHDAELGQHGSQTF